LTARPGVANAQFSVRAWLPWRTIETQRFAFHYPLELEAWTRDVAQRIESIDSAVSRIVGYRPPRKTHIVVDDPYVTANGSAWPLLDRPIINFWATPPDPRDDIGTFHAWGEMLATHEFAHIAHLVRPSRNTLSRTLWSILPANLGPVARKAPRWAIEGYATFVEGRITGSGRPHGAWRAAFLRQWALEGAMPSYQQLDSWGAYAGGEFAYLAGSAYLEWLVQRQGGGDSSLVFLWRRLSAKRNRGFDEAFIGVFGESPATLYRRFVAELTAKSIDASASLAKTGLDTGSIVQRLSWGTGDPAISPDGERVALVVRSATRPPRLVIWRTAAEPDTMRAKRDSALINSDPEDVPARPIYPPPKKELAVLHSVGGMAFQGPRFLSDGRILVWRYAAVGDGTLTTDLFLWDPNRRSVRRITHGARVRNGDPSPDGRFAVAERCAGGHCDIVRVDLETGVVATIESGDARRSYYRPRLSPDGRSVAVSVHASNRWRLQVLDLVAHTSRFIDSDDGANRYDVAFVTPNAVVAVSEAGGIPNIETIDLVSHRTAPLTRVTGAAVAPAPSPRDSSIWFLSLYSRGYDVRRIRTRPPDSVAVVSLADSLVPAVPVPVRDSIVFGIGPVSPPRRYSLRPRLFRWIPAPQWSADGVNGVLALVSSDIIGRSEIMAQAAYGEPGTWRGGTLGIGWRGTRAPLRLALFDAEQIPSANAAGVSVPAVLDSRLSGGSLSLSASTALEERDARLRLLGSIARLAREGDSADVAGVIGSTDATTRGLGVIEVSASWQRRRDAWRASAGLGGNIAYGTTGDRAVRRYLGSARVGLSAGGLLGIAASALLGDVNASADPFEQFSLGGSPSTLMDESLLAQRIVMPVLPTGIDVGPKVFAYRVSIPLAPLSPYFWAASTTPRDGRFENWHRVAGADFNISVPRIPLLGTPAARGQIGIGYSLDEPYAKKTRAYLSLVFP